MTDFDLDRLGEVWRARPDAAEMAALQRSAEIMRRRARLSQIAEAALAVIVSGVVLSLALSNPRFESLLAGGAAILLMLGSSLRQRQLRRLELRSLGGTTEDMLQQSIARAEATLKRNRLSLISAVPGLFVGYLFAAALDPDGQWLSVSGGTNLPILAPVTLGMTLVVLGILLYYLIRQRRDARRELERLVSLREAYRKESEATDHG